MERDRLVTALKDVGWGPPTLTYQSLGSGRPASGSIAATELSPGFYAFDNPALRMARIKVRIAYPFPRGRNAFPVLFRGYQVAAPATVTLVLHSQHTYSPGGYAFLGIGRQWHVSEFAGGRELVVDAGEPNDLLGSDTGIFLFWSEHDPNDPTIESFI
jgi:hypothetical protein